MNILSRLLELSDGPLSAINYYEYKELFNEYTQLTDEDGRRVILKSRDEKVQKINSTMKALVLKYE